MELTLKDLRDRISFLEHVEEGARERIRSLEGNKIDFLSGWGLLIAGIWTISSISFLVIVFTGGFNAGHHQNGSWECIEWQEETSVIDFDVNTCTVFANADGLPLVLCPDAEERIIESYCVREAWVRGVDLDYE